MVLDALISDYKRFGGLAEHDQAGLAKQELAQLRADLAASQRWARAWKEYAKRNQKFLGDWLDNMDEQLAVSEAELARYQHVAQSEQESTLDAWIAQCAKLDAERKRLLRVMEKHFLLVRLADYARLEIEAGIIDADSPVGIAYRDYAAVQPNAKKPEEE